MRFAAGDPRLASSIGSLATDQWTARGAGFAFSANRRQRAAWTAPRNVTPAPLARPVLSA
ncbi:hypothetical protein CCR94_23855 [Rhodoblastus sphagnicola]|uniref:Uncharacterized protein n=1 Tax=Rhodoblastus sphagnicola TaxID=333368 RepID=A0A2S6MTY0_9HYPH|nr:hypothetical protein CCR94_23855 [Rhodoblastus sphagnicola]